MKVTDNKYDFSADMIRIFAIFGAISIHLVQPFYGRWDYLGGRIWWIANIWNAFSRTSIPLFIMISGFFMLQKSETIRSTFNRIVYRLFIPLLVWSFLYAVWTNLFTYNRIAWLDVLLTPLHGGIFIYYFLGILIGLYTLTPILRYVYGSTSNRLSAYLTTICILTPLILAAYLYATRQSFPTNIFTHWLLYIGYFVSGGVIARHEIKVTKTSLLVLFCLYWIFTSLMGWVNLELIKFNTPILFPDGMITAYFDYYVSPNVYIMSVSLFLLILKTNFHLMGYYTAVKHIVNMVARSSFGMYLTHPFILDFLYNNLRIHTFNLSVQLLLSTLIVFTGSFFISFILSSTPGLKVLVGNRS